MLKKDLEGEEVRLIQELVDLRLLHKVKSRVTVRDRSDIYEAYMVDISQYTGSRARRELDIIQFWRSDENSPPPEENSQPIRGRPEDKLRRAGLIYNPRSIEELDKVDESSNVSRVRRKKETTSEQKSTPEQQKLF